MNNKLPKSNMRQVAVLGLGRFGAELTKALYNSGCEVLAVDQNEDRIYEIADNATHAVATNVAEESNLRQIGITEFDGVVIAIGDNIQASIITALNCKEMGCNYIVAKAQNAKHARVLEKIGVDYVIIPEADSAVKTARLLTQPQISDIVNITSNYSIAQVAVPEDWAGKKLSEMNLRNRFDVNVLIVISGSGVNSMPSGETTFARGDKMVIGGESDSIKSFADRIAKG